MAKRIQNLAEQYTNNCAEFSVATVTHDEGPSFSDMYHSLIHSPALGTLLQLEHTYALAMDNSLQAWRNARENMAKRLGCPDTQCPKRSVVLNRVLS